MQQSQRDEGRGSDRLEELFQRALELGPDERREHLERCRREDAELAAELESLLAAHEDNTGFLAGLAAEGARAGDEDPWRELVQSLKAHRGGFARYRLQSEVGRGGMGYVRRAFDRELERTVAMKLLDESPERRSRQRSPSASSFGLFFKEAKVMAGLDHPGIVPVHELGLDQDGRAYFTMRFVRGRELDLVFDLAREGREGWNLHRALGVVLKTSETIAYAHSKGVLHRDLKPANVMVGRFGEAYVMDWGLARVADRFAPTKPQTKEAKSAFEKAESETAFRLGKGGAFGADTPFVTADGTVLGTPAYMAPEQACGAPLDERTDVYGLGAILYRLLTGYAPYGLPGSPLGGRELIALVATDPPPRVQELAPRTPDELAAVCEKAMARDPSQRYADASALAEDLRAFLEGRVVAAHETGPWAEARKWVRRNRALAAALAAAVLLAFAGLGATTWVQARSRRELQATNAELRTTNQALGEANARLAMANERLGEANAELERARADAYRQSRHAQGTVAFLTGIFEKAGPWDSADFDPTVREILAIGTAKLRAGYRNEPLARAALLRSVAAPHHALGALEEARGLAEESLALWREHGGGEHRDTVSTLSLLAVIQRDLGHLQAALEEAHEAVEIAERELGPDDSATHTAWDALAQALQAHSRYGEAEELARRALAGRQRTLGEDAHETWDARNNLARILEDGGFFEEARAELEPALDHARKSLGDSHFISLRLEGNLAGVLYHRGRFAEAEALYREVLEATKRTYGDLHYLTLAPLNNLAVVLRDQGHNRAARELLESSLATHERLLPAGHPRIIRSRNNIALCFMNEGHYEEARGVLERALDEARSTIGAEHPYALEVQINLAETLHHLGETGDAEALLQETLDACRRKLGDRHPFTIHATNNLGSLYMDEKRFEDALPLVVDAHEGYVVLLGAGHPFTLTAEQNRARTLLRLGRRDEARPLVDGLLARTAQGDPSRKTREDLLRALQEEPKPATREAAASPGGDG